MNVIMNSNIFLISNFMALAFELLILVLLAVKF